MEKLTPHFRFDAEYLEGKLQNMREMLEAGDYKAELLREKLRKKDYAIEKIKPVKPEKKIDILAVDSSIVKSELRYCALWALHCVVLRACFDSKEHRDLLAGGLTPYRELMYNSFLDLGQIRPYRSVEEKTNILRIDREYRALNETVDGLRKEKVKPDYLLVDGSLYTNLRKLRKVREGRTALEEFERLRKQGKLVGMVEDSHACDISDVLGVDLTNLLLFDLVLEENEYFVQRKEDINICYLKLPSKRLSYTVDRISIPLTVRWEFCFDNFVKDLQHLVGIWSLESDLLHPQIYPVRIADYLTRKVKMQGLLEKLIRDNELSLRYREHRESSY